jgi:hypothetical protein
MSRAILAFYALGALLLVPDAVRSEPADDRVLPLPIVSPPLRASNRATMAPLFPPVVRSGWALSEISQFYPTTRGCAVGDTDHDLQSEIIVPVHQDFAFSYRILENQGHGTYAEVYQSPPTTFQPTAIGDLDLDGKSDLAGQYSYYLQIYGSPDHTSYATQLKWSSPPLSNIEGWPGIFDSDGDGIPEIIHSATQALVIYEWSPVTRSMELVYDAVVDPHQELSAARVVADLDGDGRCEIAVAGTWGYFHVLRSTANNTWTEVYVDRTGLSNAYGVAGGRDTDGNGRPEVFLLGDGDGGNDVTYVYEATESNSFARVDSIIVPNQASGLHDNAVADVVGDGRGCYLMVYYPDQGPVAHLLVFESPAIGTWSLVQDYVSTSSAFTRLTVSDADHDGREEVYWERETHMNPAWHSSVLGVPKDPTSAEVSFRVGPLQVSPSPCRSLASFRIPSTASRAACVAIFDVAGRLLDRRPVPSVPGTQVQWPVESYPSGMYIVQLRDAAGAPVAAGRVVVAR